MLRGRLATLKSLPAALCIAVLLLGGPAHADKVDSLARSLKTGSDAKVRISAALSLLKLRDQRAIEPLLAALQDRDKTVRGVSASVLGKLVDARTDSKTRTMVLKDLINSAVRDSDPFVRKQALLSYKAIALAQLRE